MLRVIHMLFHYTALSLCSRLASFAVSWAWHSVLHTQCSSQNKSKSLERDLAFLSKLYCHILFFFSFFKEKHVLSDLNVFWNVLRWGPLKGRGLRGCPVCHCMCLCFRKMFVTHKTMQCECCHISVLCEHTNAHHLQKGHKAARWHLDFQNDFWIFPIQVARKVCD